MLLPLLLPLLMLLMLMLMLMLMLPKQSGLPAADLLDDAISQLCAQKAGGLRLGKDQLHPPLLSPLTGQPGKLPAVQRIARNPAPLAVDNQLRALPVQALQPIAHFRGVEHPLWMPAPTNAPALRLRLTQANRCHGVGPDRWQLGKRSGRHKVIHSVDGARLDARQAIKG